MSTEPMLLRQILTTSGLFFAAQIVAKLLNFLFFMLLARWLSVEHFGILSYAVSVALVVDIIADMGMTRLLLRDVSRRPMIAERRLALFLPLKAMLGICLYALAVGIVIGSHPKDPATAVFGIISFTVLITGATLLSEQILHSFGRFGYAAVAHLTLAVTQLGGTVLVHSLGGEIRAIALTMVIGNMAYLGVILFGVHRSGVRLRLRWTPLVWPRVLRQSVPFAAVSILILLVMKIEFFVLGYLADATDLGRFGGASRIFDAAFMAPLTLCAVLTPRFIQQQDQSKGNLAIFYAQSLRIMILATVFIALLGAGLAQDVVRLLLPPDYSFAGEVLRVLFYGFPGLSLYFLNVALMLGVKTQLRPALMLIGLVILQVVVAFAMISPGTDLGAARAMVISSTIGAIVSSFAVRFWLLEGFSLPFAIWPAAFGFLCAQGAGAATFGLHSALHSLLIATVFAVGSALAIVVSRSPASIKILGRWC